MPSPLGRSGVTLTHTASKSPLSGQALAYGALVLTFWSLLMGGAGLLMARRWAGAFDSPLTIAALAATGFLLALVAHAARAALPGEWFARQHGWPQIVADLTGLSVAILGAMAVSLPKSPPLGLVLLWSPLLFEGIAALRELTSRRPPVAKTWLRAILSRAVPLQTSVRSAGVVRQSQVVRQASGSKVHELQTLVRWEAGDVDSLRGRVLVRLSAGRRTASAHVAFCPPFAETPAMRIKARSLAGMDVSVGQVLPHGARFDVKLSTSSARPLAVPIEFRASGPAVEST